MKLWKHQEKMVQHVLEKQRVLLAAGCSTGKTLVAITVMEKIGGWSLVMTTKAAITSAWGNDHKKHQIKTPILLLNKGSSADKAKLLAAQTAKNLIVVVNYETAKLLPLWGYKWSVVVCDESHKVGSHNSAISKYLRKYLHSKYRICMTGTPYEDKPLTLFGQVSWLYPDKFPKYQDFFDRYAISVPLPDNKYVRIPVGWQNLDELAQRVAPFTMHIKTEDVVELPAERHIEVPIELSPEQYKAHKELVKEKYTRLNEDEEIAIGSLLELSLRLHQVSCGYYLPTGAEQLSYFKSNPKLEKLLELLEEIAEPTVIFTRFRADVTLIKSKLPDSKLLVGGLQEHVSWQSGQGTHLIANIAAGSAGVDLTRARFCIYYSTGYSRTDFTQSLSRTRRANSTADRVTYYHLIGTGTVDEDIYSMLRSKELSEKDLTEKIKSATLSK